LQDRKRHLLGSSLFGTNEIFTPIQDLKNELHKLHGDLYVHIGLRSLSSAKPLRPHLYFVKMDITAAFDTIKQDKMLQIVSDILDKVSL